MVTSLTRTAFVAACASAALVGSMISGAGAATGPVSLGTAGTYAVLAGQTVTNTGPTTVHGNLGLSPGSAVTGFPPGVVSSGAIHAADAAALTAKADLTTAFDDAAGRASTGAITANLGGQTLVPGVYTGGALALGGVLTLDGLGDANAVFVFQAASTLITASGSTVALINGAAACRVFWQVGSSATIGTTSTFVGTVLALTSIAAQTNASIHGRLLARNGEVTLDSNTFTAPSCASAAPTPTTTIAGAVAGSTVPGAVTSTIPGRVTSSTLPRSGSGHALFKMKAAVAAVIVGGALVLTGRRTRRGGRVTVVTATIPPSK
jgi:hypothetical protein